MAQRKNKYISLGSSRLCGRIKGIEMKSIIQIKPLFMLTLFAILFVLVTFSPSWATTYYVDVTNGNDSNLGTSESAPWKTIAKVKKSQFQPGGFILFKPHGIQVSGPPQEDITGHRLPYKRGEETHV